MRRAWAVDERHIAEDVGIREAAYEGGVESIYHNNLDTARLPESTSRTSQLIVLLGVNTHLPYNVVLYMQSILIIWCFICKVSLSCSVLYAKFSYNLVLYMQSVMVS